MASSKTIVWFRRDLRIEDNPALAAAARDGSVFPVYIWCPKEEEQFYPGRVSRWWLKQTLAHLGQSLKSLGAELVLIRTENTLSALLKCIEATGATKIAFNHLYDPFSLVRDNNIKEKLMELGISMHSYNADLLYEPWEIYDVQRHAFRTFDGYWNKCLNMTIEPASHPPPWRLVPLEGGNGLEKCSIEELALENELEKASNALLGKRWSPGWSNAEKALSEFMENRLIGYSKNRQNVRENSTSSLSPYLHFGELSVRKVYRCAQMKLLLWRRVNSQGEESVTFFLKAIGLREYGRYLCFNFPFTHDRPLLSNLKHFPWESDYGRFKAWKQGRTGYPLVDAGMRELWATGWIHNRIRVIAASFSVKFLLLPWQWGLKYFWDTLLDADLENNILGWQYISGSLPDGHELDRMDCPLIQGSKYDPEGEYVRHWLPELARMPAEWIHHPWDAPVTVLDAAGVELGLNYPKPITDIDSARKRLTEGIYKMWEVEATENPGNPDKKNEVVVDNSEGGIAHHSPTPIVTPEQKTPCPTYSSNDQKVPSLGIQETASSPRKRLKHTEESHNSKADNHVEETSTIKSNEDLRSTAESSTTKPATHENLFPVPQSGSSSDIKPVEEHESSDINRPCLERMDLDQSSSKSGAIR